MTCLSPSPALCCLVLKTHPPHQTFVSLTHRITISITAKSTSPPFLVPPLALNHKTGSSCESSLAYSQNSVTADGATTIAKLELCGAESGRRLTLQHWSTVSRSQEQRNVEDDVRLNSG
jgi:hypothetical protein